MIHRTNWMVWTVVLLGLACFGLLGQRLYVAESDSIARGFRNDVEQKAAAFEREVLLNLEILHTLKTTFVESPEVTAERFERLTRQVLERSPVIQAIAWAPHVSNAEKPAFEARHRQREPGFEVTERNDRGERVPVAERPWYVPVAYIEPVASNRAALGFDLASEKRRLTALLAARDTGSMVATAGITLVQEPSNQRGFLAFTPMYRGEPQTIQERRDSHYAFLNGVYRIGELFNQSIGFIATGDILVRVIDRTNGAQDILYASDVPDEERWLERFSTTVELSNVAGRDWVIEAVPARVYIERQRGYLPLLVFVSGCILIALLLGFVVVSQRHNHALNEAKQELEKISLTDSLTELANRRHFDRHLEQEWARAKRQGTSISLIMIDIDHFKPYNDEYGHPAGDQCLKQVAHGLSNVARRPSDLVARYGGEEFAIILPETENASDVAEACRETVAWLRIPHGFSDVSDHITISAGVHTLVPTQTMTPDVLTERADEALYRAKEGGRNRVEVYPD